MDFKHLPILTVASHATGVGEHPLDSPIEFLRRLVPTKLVFTKCEFRGIVTTCFAIVITPFAGV